MNIKRWLQLWFLLVLLAMSGVTAWALWGDKGSDIWEGFARVGALPWGLATLFDAYFGFVAFWLWIAYRESTWAPRLLWLAAVLSFGNFAMAGYALWTLARWEPSSGAAGLLLRPAPASRPGRARARRR